MTVQDSGERRVFTSGAVRDISGGKGRCDLLPLGIIGEMMADENLENIERYIRCGDPYFLYRVITDFGCCGFGNLQTALLEVSKHYEDGCAKYGERNWEKGIPLHSYIDSAVRHYLKHCKGDDDERHDRAFLWNLLGALWTQKNKPDLIDLPFRPKEAPDDHGLFPAD